MSNSNAILKIYEESFTANLYTVNYFRMVGLIDVSIEYYYGIEKVTLAFYSSSGTNNGKIKGLWYPIVGITTESGSFQEFTPYLNFVLTKTTRSGFSKAGWLAKSLFFFGKNDNEEVINGFSYGRHHDTLLKIGETLRDLYEVGRFTNSSLLVPHYINETLTASVIYPGNTHTQQENFERFVQDIYHGN